MIFKRAAVVLRGEGLFVFMLKAWRYTNNKFVLHKTKTVALCRMLRICSYVLAISVVYYLISRRFRYIVNHPVFIVGCRHSGTTLLLRLIGTHPDYHAVLNESYLFCPQKHWLVYTKSYFPNFAHRIFIRYELAMLDMETYKNNKLQWIEKTPQHIYHIGDIFEYKPDAKVVIIIRDGRDVAVSIKRRTGNIRTGIDDWVDMNKAGEPWWNHRQVRVIRYESLIERFEITMERLFEFLGKDFSDQCYQFDTHYLVSREGIITFPGNVSDENILDYRQWQVQQPLFDGRGKWKNEMSESDIALFRESAGRMLANYGYV